jgi:hypothetical protein
MFGLHRESRYTLEVSLSKKYVDSAGLEMRQPFPLATPAARPLFISILAAMSFLAACSEKQPDSSGLVCGSAVAQSSSQKTNPLLEATKTVFFVPANFSPSAGTLAVYNITGKIQYERYLPGFPITAPLEIRVTILSSSTIRPKLRRQSGALSFRC